jgi:hypothetical protein
MQVHQEKVLQAEQQVQLEQTVQAVMQVTQV